MGTLESAFRGVTDYRNLWHYWAVGTLFLLCHIHPGAEWLFLVAAAVRGTSLSKPKEPKAGLLYHVCVYFEAEDFIK